MLNVSGPPDGPFLRIPALPTVKFGIVDTRAIVIACMDRKKYLSVCRVYCGTFQRLHSSELGNLITQVTTSKQWRGTTPPSQ